MSDQQAQVPEEIAVQPALPSMELPDFEGLSPVGVITKVNGAGQRIHRAMHLEERGVLVVEYEVANVGHGLTDDGVKRIHTLRVRDLYELQGKAGASLLRSLRQAYRVADDMRHGRRSLPGLERQEPIEPGAEGWVDASGTQLLDEDLAGIRGDHFFGLPIVEAFVIVFEGGQRAVWPDEFEAADRTAPTAGELLVPPGGDEPVVVRQVLDVDTGEALDVWTDQQEDARLEALELEAAAREAEIAEADNAGPRDETVVPGPFTEPWEKFDVWAVRAIKERIDEMTVVEDVFAIASYEERHKRRKSILTACGRRAAELQEAAE
jgi:hypothetical protein